MPDQEQLAREVEEALVPTVHWAPDVWIENEGHSLCGLAVDDHQVKFRERNFDQVTCQHCLDEHAKRQANA